MDLVGEDLDALITLGFQADPWRRNLRRLYAEARARVQRPVALAAAEGLVRAVKPGSTVVITAGFVTPFWFPRGENDGPPGGAVLAHALQTALEARVVFLAEEPITPVIRAACDAAGLASFEWKAARRIPLSVAVGSFPVDEAVAERRATELLDELGPVALVATEKCGRNAKGVYHTGYGFDISADTAKIDHLFDAARRQEILTIGVGDLGNEIGMGGIVEPVRDTVPNGRVCQCPCGGGIATVTEVDVPIPAATCDWGLYAVAAAVSALTGRPDALLPGEMLPRIVEACVAAGSRDGVTMRPLARIDGMPMSVHTALLEMLRTLVQVRQRRTPLQEFRKVNPHLPTD
jgi:hypothetical protein